MTGGTLVTTQSEPSTLRREVFQARPELSGGKLKAAKEPL